MYLSAAFLAAAPVLRYPSGMPTPGPHGSAARTRGPRASLPRRVLDALIVVSASSVVAFHAWLLWTRISAGAGFDPASLGRWTAALLILGGLFAIRRMGFSLVRSRHAAVLWLLAAFLHVGVAPPTAPSGPGANPDPGLLFAVPAASAAVLTLATAIRSASRRARVRVWRVRPGANRWRVVAWQPETVRSGYVLCEGPRPPPLDTRLHN